MFYGAVINAAYGIANQVGGQLSSFSVMMLKAVNPQIMKSEGANDRERMLRLAMISRKFSFFLLALFAIPIIFEMDELLSIWLKTVPEHTVLFCRLVLVSILTNQLTIGLQSAIQATGKIKGYQLAIGLLLLLNLPISFFLLKAGFPAYSVLVCYILIEGMACISRIYFLKALAGLSVREYFSRVINKEIGPILTSVVISFIMVTILDFPFRFLLTITVSIVFTGIVIFYAGLCLDEKKIVKDLYLQHLKK